ncbi:hypothetical protein ACFHW2_40895 [Actinomadura sp. LOL_016]|uniref:hypothetical protein n=1 Tax=unclassified Actinomadura TaxID=2626254 RepID=UPI003A813795
MRWERRLARTPPGAFINKAAIAKVIADHLWDTGERPDTDTRLARRIKDRVYRALAGDVISAETLEWFMDAFDMTEEHRTRLWAARFPRITETDGGPVIDTLRRPQFVPLKQRHRTIAVFERRRIGPAGFAIDHRTTRALLAYDDKLESFPVRPGRGTRTIRVQRGGFVAARHEFVNSASVIEISLNAPLRRGQVTSLEYELEFEPGANASQEYRRVAHARCENVDIVVQFDPVRVPRAVWWTIWNDYRKGEVLFREPAALDREQCVHRFLPYLENSAVGFCWAW